MSPTHVTVALRWSDQDANGHLNNAKIVTVMEEARVRWTRQRREFEGFRSGVVVASLQVDYLAQADYRSEMVIAVGVERIGTKSFTVRHTGFQGGKEVFRGTTVMVPLADGGAGARALTDTERSALQAGLVEDAEA